jgi:hypothetical protein
MRNESNESNEQEMLHHLLGRTVKDIYIDILSLGQDRLATVQVTSQPETWKVDAFGGPVGGREESNHLGLSPGASGVDLGAPCGGER